MSLVSGFFDQLVVEVPAVLLFLDTGPCHVKGHRLHTAMSLVSGFFDQLVVEEPLALLHCKLKESSKDPDNRRQPRCGE